MKHINNRFLVVPIILVMLIYLLTSIPAEEKQDKIKKKKETLQKSLETVFGKPAAVVPVVKTPPKIDGKLDDAVWKDVSPFRLNFIQGNQTRGVGGTASNNPPPTPAWKLGEEISREPVYLTTARILTDREYVYVSFYCPHPGIDKRTEKQRANETVEIFLDVGHLEENNFFQICIDANGKICHTAARGHDKGWKPEGLKASTVVETDLWTMEMKIPLKVLWPDPTLKSLPKLWGANFNRSLWLKSVGMEDTAWASTGCNYAQFSDHFGHLYFEAGGVEPKELKRSKNEN